MKTAEGTWLNLETRKKQPAKSVRKCLRRFLQNTIKKWLRFPLSAQHSPHEKAHSMRTLNTFTRYKFNNIRNRLADLQLKYNLPDPARQIIQNEIEAAALHWYLEAGGTESEFESKFNAK